jgi:hypothetical protein
MHRFAVCEGDGKEFVAVRRSLVPEICFVSPRNDWDGTQIKLVPWKLFFLANRYYIGTYQLPRLVIYATVPLLLNLISIGAQWLGNASLGGI